MGKVERRDVLRGAAVIGAGAAAAPLLAACGGGSSKSGTPATSAPAGGGVTVATSKVPVGGGIVDGSVVITQPTAGNFKAFSSTCTHRQCTVAQVQGGFIICPCHNSHYAIADGVPTAAGPATQPLPPKTVTVSGNNLVVT
jgi:Rieske Fe-S protein